MPLVRSGADVLRGVRGLLVSFPVVLFTGAVVTDVTYLRTAEIQWTNFSAWLIVVALVFGGLVTAWALIEAVFARRSRVPLLRFGYPGLWAAAWILGLVNAFKHSQDGWSSVGAFGLILSILCALISLIAGFLAFAGWTTLQEDAR
jgi:uncharacterized membrane protein